MRLVTPRPSAARPARPARPVRRGVAVVAASVLVAGPVVAVSPASATPAAPRAAVWAGAAVAAGPAPVSGPARAAGLIVTGPVPTAVLQVAATTGLAGNAAVVDVAHLTGTTRVVGFDGPVPVDVARRVAGELAARPDVESAVPDHVRTVADAPPVSVNDPLFPQQDNIWDFSRPAGGYSTRAPAFWPFSLGDAAVRVAVLDTGSTPHPDLVWQAGRDVVDRDDDPSDPGGFLLPSAGDFHGTHVAGTVAARANNRIGVAGVAPGVSLVPVRVLGGDGSGRDSDIVRGILWAAGVTIDGSTNGLPIRVISMSLGGEGACTAPLASAIARARSGGIVVVAAAGNDGRDAAGFAPANCPGVISVGATDSGGARASFSNTGSTVDISAPGVDVLSTSRQGGDPAYRALSGTSMAAPAVAGAAALLASTGLSSARIEAVLPTMVTPATTPGTPGVLNLTAPLRARAATQVSAKVASTRLRQGARATVRVRLRSAGGRPSGTIRVFDGARLVRRATVPASGSVTVRTPRLRRAGKHRLKVVYLGGPGFAPGRSVVRVVRVR